MFAAGRVAASEVGQVAPNCKLSIFSEDKVIDVSQYRGNVVYLDFWASWCPPCVESFSFLNGMHHEFHSQGLIILGVNLDEEPDDARAFLGKCPAAFDVLADQNAACAKRFDVKAMPSSYLIDRKGVIRHIHLGFRPGETMQIKTIIQQLLAENQSASLAVVDTNK